MGAQGFEEFVAVAECGSLTAAASQLGLPRPTLSRRLAVLEERLGVRLLHRTTRKVQLTTEGETFYPRARRVVLATREAEDEVRRLDGVPRGLLRVATPAGMPAESFSPLITDFLAEHSEVQLELVGSSAYVDLIAEGFDLALRTGPIDDPSLVVRTFGFNNTLAVASPAYLAKHGRPAAVEELASHNCLLGYERGVKPELQWPLHDGGTVSVSGSFMTNQMDLRLAAARRDLGIALVMEPLAATAIEAGELEVVLPGVVGRSDRLALVFADRQFVDPKVRAFVDFMVPRMQALRERGR